MILVQPVYVVKCLWLCSVSPKLVSSFQAVYGLKMYEPIKSTLHVLKIVLWADIDEKLCCINLCVFVERR